jgi:DNA-binding NtrC family response regulator
MLKHPSNLALGRNVLSISSAREDHDSLRRILNDPSWRVNVAFSCQQAMTYLCRDRIGIIVCDCFLRDGSWRDILSHIADLTEPPVVIVTTGAAGADFRAEVHALGGFEVLSKPFREEEVTRIAIAAWQNRSVTIPEPAPA